MQEQHHSPNQSPLERFENELQGSKFDEALNSLKELTATNQLRWGTYQKSVIESISTALDQISLNVNDLRPLWEIIKYVATLKLESGNFAPICKFLNKAIKIDVFTACSIIEGAIREGSPEISEERISKTLHNAAEIARSTDQIKFVVDLCVALIESNHRLLKQDKFVRLIDDITRITVAFAGFGDKDSLFKKIGKTPISVVSRQEHGARLSEAIAKHLKSIDFPPESDCRPHVSAQHLTASAVAIRLAGADQIAAQDRKTFSDLLRLDKQDALQLKATPDLSTLSPRAEQLLVRATQLSLDCFELDADKITIRERFVFTPRTLRVFIKAIAIAKPSADSPVYGNLATILHCALSIHRTNPDLHLKSMHVVDAIKTLNNPTLPLSKRLNLLDIALKRGLQRIEDKQYLKGLEAELLSIFDTHHLKLQTQDLKLLENLTLAISTRQSQLS